MSGEAQAPEIRRDLWVGLTGSSRDAKEQGSHAAVALEAPREQGLCLQRLARCLDHHHTFCKTCLLDK